jgi:phosphate transport system substrate-binding protein
MRCKRGVSPWVAAVVVTMTLAAVACAQVAVDPKLPVYKPVSGVSGSVKSIGSDTMNNLMTLWAEGFRGLYPSVTIEI